MRIEHVAETIMGGAMECHAHDGLVVTMSFAVGPKFAVYASPIDAIGESIPNNTRVMLHATMAYVADARFVGRVDEAWVREQTLDDEVPMPGDLARAAETDPNVRTCLIVEVVDMVTADTFAITATMQMDDWGRISWETATHDGEDEHGGRIPDELQAVRRLTTTITPDNDPPSYEDVIIYGSQCHWTVARSQNQWS